MFRIKNKKLNIFQLTDSELEKAGVSKASKNFLEALDETIFLLTLFASGVGFFLVLFLLFLSLNFFRMKEELFCR
jgi:hypothetical protein